MRKKQQATSGLDWNVMLGLSLRLKKDKLYRDYVLIIMGCYFGLRIGDLLKIRFNDILSKKEYLLAEQKTKKQRRITINPAVTEACELYANQLKAIGKFSADDFVFSNRWDGPVTISYVNKRLKVIFHRYNIDSQQVSTHVLRKTFGRRIYDVGGKSEKALVYLSEIFSHSNLAITRRYIGISQENIANVYLSL